MKVSCPMGHVQIIAKGDEGGKCPTCGQQLREVVRDQVRPAGGSKLRD